MKIRLFDPEGIKPVDYKATYPELGRTPEFEDISGKELIFIWYFANKTSPLVDIKDLRKRAEEALKISEWQMPRDAREKILDLQFGEKRENAVTKMSSYEPGARYYGWKALKNIFDSYNKIVDGGPEGFTKETKDGDIISVEMDISTYVNVTAKISAALPDLITKMEEGFGVTIKGKRSSDDDDDSEVAILRDWNILRQQQGDT